LIFPSFSSSSSIRLPRDWHWKTSSTFYYYYYFLQPNNSPAFQRNELPPNSGSKRYSTNNMQKVKNLVSYGCFYTWSFSTDYAVDLVESTKWKKGLWRKDNRSLKVAVQGLDFMAHLLYILTLWRMYGL
jgi:hypothetical protein